MIQIGMRCGMMRARQIQASQWSVPDPPHFLYYSLYVCWLSSWTHWSGTHLTSTLAIALVTLGSLIFSNGILNTTNIRHCQGQHSWEFRDCTKLSLMGKSLDPNPGFPPGFNKSVTPCCNCLSVVSLVISHNRVACFYLNWRKEKDWDHFYWNAMPISQIQVTYFHWKCLVGIGYPRPSFLHCWWRHSPCTTS